MKKYLAMFLLIVVVVFGCSRTNPIAPTSGSIDPSEMGGTQRPEFIDTRPPELIQQFFMANADPVPLDENSPKGAKYALCIGISAYPSPYTLNYCDDDANDWAAYLASKGFSVTKLIDKAATKSAIESAVNTLASRAVSGNTIVFPYSGHGSYYNSVSNMISVDLYYLSSTWLAGKFANATSSKIFFTFDACQIGNMKTKLGTSGRVVAVASSTSTYSYDGNTSMKNGVFTYYQMYGFYNMGYTYAEIDASYACTQMKNWASANGVTVAPSYYDGYSGSWTF